MSSKPYVRSVEDFAQWTFRIHSKIRAQPSARMTLMSETLRAVLENGVCRPL